MVMGVLLTEKKRTKRVRELKMRRSPFFIILVFLLFTGFFGQFLCVSVLMKMDNIIAKHG